MTEQNGRIHDQVFELLSAYLDGEVTAGERELVEAHLASCTTCAYDLATLRQTVSLLGQLPQVPAPRPFTLRESDLRRIRPARPAWWRLPWAQRLAAAAAVLLCTVVIGGVVLLGRVGMVGTPAAPAPVAMKAPAETEAPSAEVAAQKLGAEADEEAKEQVVVEVEKEVVVEEKAVEAAAPAAATEATAALDMLQEAPAEAPQAESEALTGEGQMPTPSAAPRAAAGAQPLPTTTPAPVSGATSVISPSILLEVEDLNLEIEPGVIRVSGRLPLPEGRKLVAELWLGGHPTQWATPTDQPLLVQADGRFCLELRAQPEAPDLDLFAMPAADYEIRIRPVDPPEPVEARIPFDTYGPPPALPTPSP